MALKPIFDGLRPSYLPEEFLDCSYRIESYLDSQIVSMETSVLWRTEGKGDEDLGVHFFDRRQFSNTAPCRPDQRFKLHVRLPLSPLSYQGFLIKIDWVVRVHLILANGQAYTIDTPFSLQSLNNATASCNWPKQEDTESKDAVD